MKALVWRDIDKIELVEKPIPEIVEDSDAIVKVTYSSICTSDLHIIKGFVPNSQKGIVLGHEFVGEVVSVGSNVKSLQIGDRVSANCETFCGECYFCKRGYINNCELGGWHLGCSIDGCQAEYVRVPFADNGLKVLPNNVSYKNALFVGDILSSGYFGAELCEIKQGDTVAIIGVGPVGLCATQCARYLGAGKIVLFDVNESRLEKAKELGFADVFVNPNKEDYINIIDKHTFNRGADAVIECAGTDKSFEMAWQIARPNSVVALVAMYENAQNLPLSKMYGKNLIFKTGGVDAIHCEKLLDLISQGVLNTDFLISKTVAFDNIMNAYDEFEKKKSEIFKIAVSYE